MAREQAFLILIGFLIIEVAFVGVLGGVYLAQQPGVLNQVLGPIIAILSSAFVGLGIILLMHGAHMPGEDKDRDGAGGAN